MDNYGFLDAFIDLDALESGSIDAEQKAAAISRIRGLFKLLEQTAVMVGDDQ